MANSLKVDTIQDINGKIIYSQTGSSATIGDATVSGTSLTLPSQTTYTFQNLTVTNKLTASKVRFNTRLQIGDNTRAVMDLGAATDAIILPRGTEAQRPTSTENGQLRYNTDTNKIEGYVNDKWSSVNVL